MSNSGQGNETMKKLILLILALALPLAQIARADENQDQKKHKRTAEEQRREEAARKAAQAPHRTVNKAVQPVHHPAAPVPRASTRRRAGEPPAREERSQPGRTQSPAHQRSPTSPTSTARSRRPRSSATGDITTIIATAITSRAAMSSARRTTAPGGGPTITRPTFSSAVAIITGGITIGIRLTATARSTIATSTTSRSTAITIWPPAR